MRSESFLRFRVFSTIFSEKFRVISVLIHVEFYACRNDDPTTTQPASTPIVNANTLINRPKQSRPPTRPTCPQPPTNGPTDPHPEHPEKANGSHPNELLPVHPVQPRPNIPATKAPRPPKELAPRKVKPNQKRQPKPPQKALNRSNRAPYPTQQPNVTDQRPEATAHPPQNEVPAHPPKCNPTSNPRHQLQHQRFLH